MSELVTEGLILRVTRFRESDRFLRLLVPSGDVIEVLARSVGKSVKRFGGGLEPLSLQRFAISKRRSTMVAEQAQHVNDNLGLRLELPRFYLASYAAERALGAAPCEGLFELMNELLACLASTPPDLAALKCAFDLKLLSIVGVGPALTECGACGRALGSGLAALDPSGGGFVCSQHADAGAVMEGAGVRAVLTSLATSELARSGRLKMSPPQRLAVLGAVRVLVAKQLGGPVKSERLLTPHL